MKTVEYIIPALTACCASLKFTLQPADPCSRQHRESVLLTLQCHGSPGHDIWWGRRENTGTDAFSPPIGSDTTRPASCLP